MKKCIYLMGSLRNRKNVLSIAKELEQLDYEVFTSWLAPGEEADDKWKEYEQALGRTHKEALEGYAAQHIFEFDKHHLDRADISVLVMPAGKSCFTELGYHVGKGKPAYVLYPEGELEDRWDVMVLFATKTFFSTEELLKELAMSDKLKVLDPFYCDTDVLLENRGLTHGDYKDNSKITTLMWEVISKHLQNNNKEISPEQEYALYMIIGKISRIVSGDSSFTDHWEDIKGYSELVIKSI